MDSATVLIGSVGHETNTFASMFPKTDREAFRQREELFGDAVTEGLRGTNTAISGFMRVAEESGTEFIQTVAAMANPGYLVTNEAYEFYNEHILTAIRRHRTKLDGIALSLHGAMVSEEIEDAEGALLKDVRATVGPDVPVVATLDLHGNVSERMMTKADVLVTYETYPHVDIAETGRTAMRLLLRRIGGEINPQMAIERPPIVIAGPLQNTRNGPMATIMDRARELESRPSVLKINIHPGFYPADVPSMGCSVHAIADGDRSAARAAARDLAAFIWERRETFIPAYPTPVEAVEEAQSFLADQDIQVGPIVLADVGDNPGGGGSADGTMLLRELLNQNMMNAGFAIICDPTAVDTCISAGVGERVTVTIGGKVDERFGSPIKDVNGYVKAITDGVFVNHGPMSTGVKRHLGRTVLLQCGMEDGVSLILSEHRVQPMDTEIYRHVGLPPERFDVLVVKSTNHYRADYEPIASRVIPVDTPGLFPADPQRFEYEQIRRPQFPLDEMSADTYPSW